MRAVGCLAVTGFSWLSLLLRLMIYMFVPGAMIGLIRAEVQVVLVVLSLIVSAGEFAVAQFRLIRARERWIQAGDFFVKDQRKILGPKVDRELQ